MSQPVRDANGRFVSGHNQPGPGRKPRQTEQEYLRAMEQICDSEAWATITRRAVLDATNGDAKARSWLSGYLLGQPVARTEDTGKGSPEAWYNWLSSMQLDDSTEATDDA